MSTQRPDAALDTSAPLQLVRAAAALRWKRPDLTVTLAELALDAADDATTWAAAAGWLLHGRALLGDGRQVACDLLDGLGRWGDAGVELMAGPEGRRLRIELAGSARRAGEQAVARALLAAEPGVDAADGELRADVLSELARCAADETPGTADAALDAAEQSWAALCREPGVASVLLIRAARDRRAGRTDAAVAAAVAGLARVNASGRRAGGTDSDHLAAALTAEWIAALVDAGRLDEARDDAVPAATRLLATTRPSRQLAGLRLALARVAAVGESAGTVLAALEPAAQNAAEADVPELESACRSMLGELHEAAGRLDAALSAVRAAMAAERCDHDRGARLRTRLTAATATWAGRPSRHGVVRYPALGDPAHTPVHPAVGDAEGSRDVRLPPAEVAPAGGGTAPEGPGPVDAADEAVPAAPPASSDRAARARARAGTWSGVIGPGRRARRLAAEVDDAAAEQGWREPALPELGTPTVGRSHRDPEPAAGAEAQAPPDAAENVFDDATATLRRGPVGTSPGDRAPGAARHEGSPGATGAAAVAGTRTTDTGRSVAAGGGSLIGDALLRELIEHAGPHRAPTDEARPRATGPDDGGAFPVDSRAERRDSGQADPGQGLRDGRADLERRRNDAPAPAVRPTNGDLADTVVIGVDPRHDSTVAVPPVPPVHPTRDVADDAVRRREPGRGLDADPDPGASRVAGPGGPATRPSSAPRGGVGAQPAPSTVGSGSIAPAIRNGPTATDTVRVAPPAGHGRGAGTAPRTGPVGRGNPGGPPTRTIGAPPTGGDEPDAPDRRRPRPDGVGPAAGTDGLGIGDLLAGALAAYRGI